MENLPSTSKRKKWERPLTDQELLEYLLKDDDSEILGLSDNDDANSIADLDDVSSELGNEVEIDDIDETVFDTLIEEQITTESTDVNPEDDNEVAIEPQILEENRHTENAKIEVNTKEKLLAYCKECNITSKKDVRWKKNVTYVTRPIKWFIPEQVQVDELPAPIQFFMKYIPDDLFEKMSRMTNLYAVQKNIARFSPSDKVEIKQFVGIHIIMGNLKFPRARLYWDQVLGVSIIKDTMTFNRFSKLRNTIHLVDITARGDETDRMWKVRELYNCLRNRCRELQTETNLCVDEQIIPFKGQINIKQYLPNKPKKWGIKLWILAGQSGIIYDFIIYQGTNTEIDERYAQFGQGAGTVMQLAERIKEPHHGLYFDNYFSSYHLFQWLNQKSIMAVGTIRVNRFCGPQLLSDKELKKMEEVVVT